MPAPIEVTVDTHDLARLFAEAKAAPGKIQVELRRGVNKAAKPVADGIKAAAPSARIAGAVKVRSTFARGGATVKVIVDSKAAPNAAPVNNKGKSGRFRHPVYANQNFTRDEWRWVNQAADPFVLRGAKQGEAAADAAMSQVMDDIARQLGFH